MERLKHIKEALVSCVESQMGDLRCVDTKELGEAIDMVKDMEEAIYYCTITKAMKEKEEKKEHERHEKYHYMTPPMIHYPSQEEAFRDHNKNYDRMYYGGSRQPYFAHESGMMDSYPAEIRDSREGRSPMSRRSYMESKELHQGAPAQMKELEKYLQELTEDLMEMIEDASPEEKQVLQQKLSNLASKIK